MASANLLVFFTDFSSLPLDVDALVVDGFNGGLSSLTGGSSGLSESRGFFFFFPSFCGDWLGRLSTISGEYCRSAFFDFTLLSGVDFDLVADEEEEALVPEDDLVAAEDVEGLESAMEERGVSSFSAADFMLFLLFLATLGVSLSRSMEPALMADRDRDGP